MLKFLKNECNVDLSKPIESGPRRGITPVHIAARHGQVEVLKFLKNKCSVDLSKPIESGTCQGLTPVYAAAIKGNVEMLKFFENECGVDLSKPIESGPLQGKTYAYLAAICGHVKMLIYLGLDKNHWSFLNNFMKRNPSGKGFSISYNPLHIACLLNRDEEVQALVNLPTALIKKPALSKTAGNQIKSYNELDFLLLNKGLRIGSISDVEQKQINILKILMKNGWDRTDVMDRLRNNFPRLYNKLLSDAELILEEVLDNKKLLIEILRKWKTLPSGGYILWKQNNSEATITQNNLIDWLKSSIDCLLSKNECLNKKILPKIES